MSAELAMEVQGLGFSAGGRMLLHDVSFSVERGAFVSIIGPNGAGKSTLLKCIDMIHGDWQGSIRLRGRDARGISRRELARTVAYVPQGLEFQPPYSVREFIRTSLYARTPSPALEEDVEEALAITGLEPLAARPMATLSGGEQQKALLASAIAQKAGILLLDEPTAFLDPRHRKDICAILDSLRKRSQASILAVLHDLDMAFAYSDRIMVLKDGALIANGSPGELDLPGTLEKAFDTGFQVFRPADGRYIIAAGPTGEIPFP